MLAPEGWDVFILGNGTTVTWVARPGWEIYQGQVVSGFILWGQSLDDTWIKYQLVGMWPDNIEEGDVALGALWPFLLERKSNEDKTKNCCFHIRHGSLGRCSYGFGSGLHVPRSGVGLLCYGPGINLEECRSVYGLGIPVQGYNPSTNNACGPGRGTDYGHIVFGVDILPCCIQHRLDLEHLQQAALGV